MTEIDFRLLGPLEVHARGRRVPLGGAKQRSVLAALLLRAETVLPVEELVDDVWGEDPPPSAVHSLEAYVSRLRQALGAYGVRIERCGQGYRLEPGDARIDVRTFERLATDVSSAAEARSPRQAARLAAEALELWRGPALGDVTLHGSSAAAVARLEELRLAVVARRIDADLELGRSEALTGELQGLVDALPYRERFVAQLMLALYRSGRQADALAAYERLRTALAQDLGLQPSAELQALSGEIVRHGPGLRGPAAVRQQAPRRRGGALAAALAAGAVLLGLLAFSGGSGAIGPDGSDAGAAPEVPSLQRIALVLAEDTPDPDRDAGLSRLLRAYGDARRVETEVVLAPGTGETGAALERFRRRIEAGRFGLVVVAADGATARRLSPLVRRLRGTRFVFVDASPVDLSLAGVANASTIRFAEEESSHLAGYLSALVPPRSAPRGTRVDVVSVIAGTPTSGERRAVREFARGASRARPGVLVRVTYTNDAVDPGACERIANEQVTAGSDVIFATARCSLAALAVARARGVWAIGRYEDGVVAGPHVLALTYKVWERAVSTAMGAFLADDLHAGEHEVLGLTDNYAVGIDRTSVGGAVPESLWAEVVRRCSELRAARASGA